MRSQVESDETGDAPLHVQLRLALRRKQNAVHRGIAAKPLLDQDAYAGLRWLLAESPPSDQLIVLDTDPNQPQRDTVIPLNPFTLGARRMMLISPRYVAMQEGSGVAFVTYFAQDLLPATNEKLRYQYLALANDAEYLVSMDLPISTAVVPNTLDEFVFPINRETQFRAYVLDMNAQLYALSPSDWEPSLDVLDALAASLHIVGDSWGSQS
jgi:hypothetical protein